MTQRYRLACEGDRIPMPDRGTGVFFSTEASGESLDPLNPWHRRLIDDGSVLPIDDAEVDPAPRKGAAR